jgi:hypothetical protein
MIPFRIFYLFTVSFENLLSNIFSRCRSNICFVVSCGYIGKCLEYRMYFIRCILIFISILLIYIYIVTFLTAGSLSFPSLYTSTTWTVYPFYFTLLIYTTACFYYLYYVNLPFLYDRDKHVWLQHHLKES